MDVVRKYIALAEERTEAARQESHQTVLDIDDLDLPDSPERLGSAAVCQHTFAPQELFCSGNFDGDVKKN